MGMLKRLLNRGNAEGVREAMRASYRKHRKMAERGPGDSNLSPHHVGLFGCLASRLQTQGYLPPEPSIWDDLLPFIALSDEETAVEAVAEYVILMEEVDDGRYEFLVSMIRQGIKVLMADQERARPFHLSKPLWFLVLDEEERTRVLDWISSK